MSKVSVVMAAYNAGVNLRPAVNSILQQSFEDFELIVIDDGSTDASVVDLARSCTDSRMRIIHQANAGKPSAVNRAMAIARGEWIVIQDADDLAQPKRLELLLKKVSLEPDLGAVFSGYDILVEGKRLAPITREKDPALCRVDISEFRMPSHDPTIMFQRELGLRLKYDERLRIGQGYDFVLRLGEVAPIAVIAQNLYSYRVAWNSQTRKNPTERQRYVALVLRKACERRGLDFAKQFPHLVDAKLRSPLADNGVHRHFIESVKSARDQGDRATAWKTALESVAFQPLIARYYRPLAYAIVPMLLLRALRRQRNNVDNPR